MNQCNHRTNIKCPGCNRKIMEPSGTGVVLKNRVTIFGPKQTIAICKQCKTEVPVPVEIVA